LVPHDPHRGRGGHDDTTVSRAVPERITRCGLSASWPQRVERSAPENTMAPPAALPGGVRCYGRPGAL